MRNAKSRMTTEGMREGMSGAFSWREQSARISDFSDKHVLHDLAVNVREPVVAALVAIGESLVVDAKLVRVVIQVAVVEVDETEGGVGEPAREQAVCRVGAGLARLGTVALESVRGLLREIGEVRHARLHAECHFKLIDARLRLRVVIVR